MTFFGDLFDSGKVVSNIIVHKIVAVIAVQINTIDYYYC